MFRRTLLAIVCVPIFLGHLAAESTEKADIIKTAATNNHFKTLLNALVAADLLETLQKNDGPFTVFAPSDQAFAKIPTETVASLMKPENKEQLKAILTYHVVAGRFTAADLHKHPNPKTLNGEVIRFKVSGQQALVNDSKIVTKDIECRNGIIHVIDTVLIPPVENKSARSIVNVAREAKTFKTLIEALTVAELAEVLSGKEVFTVFAPTDEAFAHLPKGALANLLKPENRASLVSVLKYHVVAGKVTARDAATAGAAKTLLGKSVQIVIKNGRLTINDASVIASDVTADNGLIHVIDRVLLPRE